MASRDYDLVVFGATGFTGRLVAEYIVERRQPIRFAIAGRNRGKLDEVAAALGGCDVIVADALDPAAMAEVARRARVVCTTAGPYAKYGSELVAACAAAGTHYCDLTGEVPWMREMIDRHHARAEASGARIVHTCGFDSIPSDLGTWCVQQECIARFGKPASRVTGLFAELAGSMSGGTAASAIEISNQAAGDREVRRVLRNPYALDPDPSAPRPDAPDIRSIGWDARQKRFTFPFFMADVNTRVVRRSHALAGQPWGASFVYEEKMSSRGTAGGLATAVGVTGALGAFAAALGNTHVRPLVAKWLPQPGEGPSKEARERGRWKLRLVAEVGDDRVVYVAGDHADPGYGSTAKMLGESALCLAQDALTSSGGVQTPSIAMGAMLAERLRAAGLTLAPE